MSATKPPFKLALASLFLDKKSRGAADVAEALRPDYEHSPFFTPEFVAYQLHGLKAVGILQEDEGRVYSLTKSGEERVRKSL